METRSMERELQPADLKVLARAGLLSPEELEQAYRIAGTVPAGQAWHGFLNTLLLFLGAVLIVAGVVFFFAYNWASMHRLVKLGIVQTALLSAVFLTSYLGFEKVSGRAALLAASVMTGSLLALFGQIYQTGADAYELFLGWSALVGGWVLISRFPALWLLLLLLIQAAWYFFYGQVVESAWFLYRSPLAYLVLAAINAGALAAWEFLAAPRIPWLTGRWIPRLVLTMGLYWIMVPLVILIIDHELFKDRTSAALVPLVYLGAGAAALWFYRARTFDLYMVAAVLLSLIVIVSVYLGKVIGSNYFGFLLLSVLIVALSAGAATWLQSLSRSHHQEEA